MSRRSDTLCASALWLLLGCREVASLPTGDTAPADDTANAELLELRWLAGSEEMTWEQAQQGLWWSLSALGAEVADPAAVQVLESSQEEVRFTLDVAAAGLSTAAQAVVWAAWDELAATPELDNHGGVDLGRLLMRTLYEPWRYYQATEACPSLEGWQDRHPRAGEADVAIVDSMLTEQERLVGFVDGAETLALVAWLASEGPGSLDDGTFVAAETEVVDLLPSGRQRFAVYDESGRLIPFATVSPAGQPGRCMWCHEGHLMQTVVQPDIEGYGSFEDFDAAVKAQQRVLESHREGLDSLVDFDAEWEVHAWAEHLVEAFLAPSPERVAREWGVGVDEVEALALPTHEVEEYGWSGRLTRADVDAAFAERADGYVPVATLASSRDVDEDAVLADDELRESLLSCGD